jgi:uncharacterized protein YkwD
MLSTICLGTCSLASAATTKQVKVQPNVTNVEKLIEQKVNARRKKVKACNLPHNNDVAKMAHTRSGEIVKSFSHTRPKHKQSISNEPYKVGKKTYHLGENILMAFNCCYTKTVASNKKKATQKLVDERLANEFYRHWFNSSGHKANIEYKLYKSSAVAVKKSGSYYYAVQNFALEK